MINVLNGNNNIRYAIGAAICAIVNNIVLIVGDVIGFGYIYLVIIASAIGGSVGYVLHSKYTYCRPASVKSYCYFMGGISLGFPFSLGVFYFLISIANLKMIIAAPAATAIMLLYNYLNARVAILQRLFSR